MLMPGFGEIYVPARIRLLFSFVLTLAITPLVADTLPETKILSVETLVYLLRETFIGLFIGSMARIFLNGLQVTATIIGLHTSLSSAMMFNPSLGTQDSMISNLLIMSATALIFVTNTHHIILIALVNSYDTFSATHPLVMGALTPLVIRVVSQSFWIGVALSFPFMIVATVLNVSTGLLNRLMPQLQVYFMIMPLQILMGFMLLAMTIGLILTRFIDAFGALFTTLEG